MLVTTTTIILFQQKQETGAEANIPIKSEHQGSILSITTCPFIIRSPEQSKMPSTHETVNTRALDIQKLLAIHCLCIYDITGSLVELARKIESGNIIWNVENVFTSGYRSILFRSVHNNL